MTPRNDGNAMVEFAPFVDEPAKANVEGESA
jgi:hypothetical protein